MKEEHKKNLVESPPAPVLGWSIEYTQEGSAPRMTVDRTNQKVVINRPLFASENELYRASALIVAREVATTEVFRGVDPRDATKMFSEDPDFIRELLRLSGASLLKERDPIVAKRLGEEAPPATSAITEFKSACAEYLVTGKFPQTTESVRTALESLPTSPKTGEHLLSAFTNGRVALSRKQDYFKRYISPAIEQLRQVDADLRVGAREDFQPSTDDSPKGPEVLEENIEQRIEPFVGGYYREKVMDAVDWQAMKVVATGVEFARLQAPEEPRDVTDLRLHKFSGKNAGKMSSEELTLPMLASANILPETITPGFAVRQSINGTYTLEMLNGEADKSAIPDDYNFTFTRSESPSLWQSHEPSEQEQGIPDDVVATFSEETQAFLNKLRVARITDELRVRNIARRVQKNIEYVNDSTVGEALAMAGRQYFAELERLKKGDCDVTNFYALAQIRALDIPCRMITGYHVGNKDDRFEFAALAGTKHAWLEWWDKEVGIWKKIDATPPKENEDKDEDKKKSGGMPVADVNIGLDEDPRVEPDESEDDPWAIPFNEDELARLRERLGEIGGNSGGGADKSKEQANKIFKEIYGISSEKWDAVRKVAETVACERIPKEATVEKRAESTVGEEWRHILDLLLIAYRLPTRRSRVMGRESQGGLLSDPVSAGVDILVGTEDPYGYEVVKKRERVEKLPIRFSNDFLLDLTASMQARNNQGKSLLNLERDFVISSLYEGYRLNERIKQSASELIDVPVVTNHVLSIHGGNKWQEILQTAPMSLKSLSEVYDSFKMSTNGAGAMASAIEAYVKTLQGDVETLTALKNGEMLKTLTIITDGNLWCSVCGKESCSYELHGPTLDRVNKALKQVREAGVVVNVIGFTEESQVVAELFKVPNDPLATAVVEDLQGALVAHYAQVVRAMRPVLETARKRGDKVI
ncbi:MAG TPA: transglutaminase-like domain-containing protein [Candidatus Paceibacterota bacterium]